MFQYPLARISLFFWGVFLLLHRKKTNRVYAMAIETHAEEGNESEWWGNISIGWMWERAKWERQQAKTRDFLWFFLTISLLEKYIHINSMQHKRWWWWWDEKLFTNSSIERNVKCFHFHSHHLHDFISRDVMCMRMGQNSRQEIHPSVPKMERWWCLKKITKNHFDLHPQLKSEATSPVDP